MCPAGVAGRSIIEVQKKNKKTEGLFIYAWKYKPLSTGNPEGLCEY